MDYLHLEMRFTYRKMKSPSMQLGAVDNEGAVMIYRSGRSGFKRYLTGQLLEIAKQFYDSDLKVTVLESQNDTPGNPDNQNGGINEVVVKFRLDFDNREYVRSQHACVTNMFQCFLFRTKNMDFMGLFRNFSALPYSSSCNDRSDISVAKNDP